MINRFVSAIVLLLVFQLELLSQSNTKLDRYFEKQIEKIGIVGLQAAFLSEGELKWNNSYGNKRVDKKSYVNDSTLFMIASSTKPITAIGIMKLCEDGKLNLDTDINDYLPFKIQNPHHPNAKLTTRMLLSHTSSIIDNWEVISPLYTLEKGGDSPIELHDFVKDYFNSGRKYYDSLANFSSKPPLTERNYSNMGYVLCGYLIEVITEMDFEDFMYQKVFEPLNMQNTYWFLSDIPHDNIAYPHQPSDDKNEGFEILNHYGYADYPDGQIRTTVSDYAKIIELMLNEGMVSDFRFLEPETVKEMLRIQYPNVDKYQAIAWNSNEFDHWLYYLLMRRLPSHTGGDPGVATVVSFDPEENVGAIVFVNSPPSSFLEAKAFYLDMIKKLLKEATKY
ncbi:serine hydrolase domain-containing protein [Mangrovivirga cuniculi]|uniref:Beta-lactamase-related domain-containing protein n=1 Tax=Mangrovivirga cuniculi TaxID=2715131 RepID=A0A4D7KBP9_9BACT|nr:serine hydrolase [Mangrovivirga cuniculi]QCK16898.1 hypothetical protein DCC35_20250 [Mangrovivirga cuniculi]